MALPNILASTTVIGTSTGKVLNLTYQTIVQNTVNQSIRLNAMYIANTSTVSVPVTVNYLNTGTNFSYPLVGNLVVPGNSTVDIINKSIYLAENDSITATAGTTTYITIVASWETIA